MLMMNKEDALSLLQQYGPEPHMVQHALSSEAIMRALARHYNEDEELWGIAGLLHDVDYPLTKEQPAEHGLKAMEILVGKLPREVLEAISAHNSECNGAKPSSRLDYALRCAETITGLVSAAALMRPTGMEGMQVKSLKKKMKDKAFAANVSRERIRECEHMGMSLDDFLGLAIAAMTPQPS